MRIKPLYRYRRADGRVVDSPIKPEAEYTTRVRMIASEGKVLTKDGVKFYPMKDDDSDAGWYEVSKEEANAIRNEAQKNEV